ncbi:MAG: rhodanese-like domain-containing protein [Actinomycetota bacterium]|jgi:rhodanese-related sulfurtransferase|nr:rhodanese-like domain-containing protein [Actinomycetota bacterium]
MAVAVHREEIPRLLARGAQLVEVLPVAEYEEEHLPDAINVPLATLGPETIPELDRSRPVIVYCWDAL